MSAARHPNRTVQIALLVVAGLTLTVPAAALADGSFSKPRTLSERGYNAPGASDEYVALGDSIADGVGASRGGYVDLLFDDYKTNFGVDFLSKQTSATATSTTLLKGLRTGAISRIDVRTDTRIVTIGIGANDYLTGQCSSNWDEATSCPFRSNLSSALDQLAGALGHDPGSEPLIVMAYYNPAAGTAMEPMLDRELLGANGRVGLTDAGDDVGLNDVIYQEAATRGDPVADPYPAFEARGQSLISADGLHPNDAGQQAIAAAFRAAADPPPCADMCGSKVDAVFVARKKQSMRRFRNVDKIVVIASVRTQEKVKTKITGTIEVGERRFGLYLKPRRISYRKKLEPTKKGSSAIVRALKKGWTVRAKLRTKLTDEAGNTRTQELIVRLVR